MTVPPISSMLMPFLEIEMTALLPAWPLFAPSR